MGRHNVIVHVNTIVTIYNWESSYELITFQKLRKLARVLSNCHDNFYRFHEWRLQTSTVYVDYNFDPDRLSTSPNNY